MIVYDKCPDCRAQATISTSAPTPQALEEERGERFVHTCDACSRAFDVEALRTRARINPSKLLFGLAASVVLAAVILSFGYIALLAAAPAIITYSAESSAVKAYNTLSRRKWG